MVEEHMLYIYIYTLNKRVILFNFGVLLTSPTKRILGGFFLVCRKLDKPEMHGGENEQRCNIFDDHY